MNATLDLMSVWQQGDWITRSVAMVLLTMSILTWVVLSIKLLSVWKLKRRAKAAEHFWHSTDFHDGLLCLGKNDSSPWRMLAIQGYEALLHHKNSQHQLHDNLSVSDWMTRMLRNTLSTISSNLSSGLAILASIGSTAPFVGLFGTVWGIYNALINLSAGGVSSIDKVAGPIGEALIMTAFGLAVAIPAVLGYNALTRANKSINGRLQHFAHDLHAFFITGARVAACEEARNNLALKKSSEA